MCHLILRIYQIPGPAITIITGLVFVRIQVRVVTLATEMPCASIIMEQCARSKFHWEELSAPLLYLRSLHKPAGEGAGAGDGVNLSNLPAGLRQPLLQMTGQREQARHLPHDFTESGD
jgi:hypothetical protein